MDDALNQAEAALIAALEAVRIARAEAAAQQATTAAAELDDLFSLGKTAQKMRLSYDAVRMRADRGQIPTKTLPDGRKMVPGWFLRSFLAAASKSME